MCLFKPLNEIFALKAYANSEVLTRETNNCLFSTNVRLKNDCAISMKTS